MDSAYDIAYNSLKPRLRTSVSYMETIGIGLLAAHTAVVDSDGRLEEIPLDILSSAVNLKTMWNACKAPVAIVFREWMDDWCAVIPCDATLQKWELRKIPGKDHDLHRARIFAERAIQSDFHIDNAHVF